MSNLFNLSLTDIKSALITTLLMGVLAVAEYVIRLGDVYKIDTQTLVNVLVLALLAGAVSLIKSLLTDNKGVFAGVAKIK